MMRMKMSFATHPRRSAGFPTRFSERIVPKLCAALG